MGEQRVRGNCNVQVQEVENSWIQIINGAVRQVLPLESAELPICSDRPSPARLVSARSGVFSYVGRAELLGELEAWIDSPAPFAAYLVAGRGGSGKTRLAVELCLRLREWNWLCGFLARGDGEGRLDALIEAPTARLVVIDYAENRAEQLERLLPQLSASATAEEPVRVLLLVRTGSELVEEVPKRFGTTIQAVKRVIEGCDVRVLEERRELLSPAERKQLFADAAAAFASYAKPLSPPLESPDLNQDVFENTLMVVIAAYLAAHGDRAPETRGELLDGVLEHERDYWRESASELDADDSLLERAVGVATLLRAESEAQGADHLLLHPDLSQATIERRNRLARWVRDQYPGPRWWNPLEPDLVGEHLVARCFADRPAVLQGALAANASENLTRPLEVLGRAAADHPELAEALGPILSEDLQRLCRIAVAQARSAKDHDLLYGNLVTVAAALDALIAAVDVDGETFISAVDSMPARPDLMLNELATTLTVGVVDYFRPLAEVDPATYSRGLAVALNNLSSRLGIAGRHSEALAAIEDSVAVYRPLVEVDPATYAPGLADALHNCAIHLSKLGRHSEALAAIEDSVAVYRPLAEEDSAAHAPDLAVGLANLSNRLAKADRHSEAMMAIEDSVAIYRDLAEANPAPYAGDLANALNNFSNRLAEADRHSEALVAIEESVAIFRDLAEANPAAYARDLATTLNNLFVRLGIAGRHPEALAASEESVKAWRRLAGAKPAPYAGDFASALNNLSTHLAEIGRHSEALVAIEESVAIRRLLVEANPAVYAVDLARSLRNLANRLRGSGREDEARSAEREAVELLGSPPPR